MSLQISSKYWFKDRKKFISSTLYCDFDNRSRLKKKDEDLGFCYRYRFEYRGCYVIPESGSNLPPILS